MSWIEHMYGVLAMGTCFVLSWGYIGLVLMWLKACEDSHNKHIVGEETHESQQKQIV